MGQSKKSQRGRKGKEDSANFIDSVEAALGKAALMTNPAYLAMKPATSAARAISENPEAARRAVRKAGGATQRSLETVSKFTPPALVARGFDAVSKATPSAVAARLLDKVLGDDEQEEDVSRSKGDRRARADKKEAREVAGQQGDLTADLVDSFGQGGLEDGLEGALAGGADQEEPLIIDDSQFEEPEEVDIDVSETAPEMDEKESGRLFKMIMGSSFDPVSSMDKGKMDILKKAKAENPDLSDNQLALKIYRDYM